MIPKHTPEEIKQLAIDFRAGKIFSDRHLQNPEDVSMVFMVLMFLDEAAIDELKANPPAMIYEYLSEAGPRSVNGYPCFMSHKYLSKEDFEAMRDTVKKLEEAEKAVLAAGT